MENRVASTQTGPVGMTCPNCGSGNVLPFEDDSGNSDELPVIILILTALSLIALYLAFVVTSYLYFPIVVIIAVIITSRIVNRQERKRHIRTGHKKKDFLCLTCDKGFSDSGPG